MRRRLLGTTLAAIAVTWTVGTAGAAASLDLFLTAPGLNTTTADQTFAGVPGTVELLSWSWGVSRPSTGPVGGGGGSGRPAFQDVSFSRYADVNSPKLMLLVATGRRLPNALVTMRRPSADGGGRGDRGHYTYCFVNPTFTSLSTGVSTGDDQPVEHLTMNYQQVIVSFAPQNADGSYEPFVRTAFNLVEVVAFPPPATC